MDGIIKRVVASSFEWHISLRVESYYLSKLDDCSYVAVIPPLPWKTGCPVSEYQSLAAAEATGGLGSTSTSNQLATIAPTLGQQWLSGQMNNYQNLANIGLGALQGQANAGQTYANNMSQISQQSAALAAANANRPSGLQSAIGGAASGAIAGAKLGSIVPGIGTGIGAAVGGGLGLLGSLF